MRCGNELPGSLRALIAARIDQLPAPQRAIVDNAAVLGTADSIGALVRFAQAMGQEFRQRDLDELAADGLLDVDGSWWRFRSAVVREVAYQTLTKRVRAQRHAGVAAVMAERGASIDDVAHHAATAAELLAELGTVDGVNPSITDHAVQALQEAATAAVETGRHETAVRHASRALDLHPADAKVERWLLLIRSEAELERRNFAQASPTPRRCSPARSPPATPSRRARPAGASARSPRCRATWRRPAASSARPSTCSAPPATRSASPARCGPAASPRCSAARSTTPAGCSARRWSIYHRIDDERGHAWTHQNLAWVSFSGGDVRRGRGRAAGGQAALRASSATPTA